MTSLARAAQIAARLHATLRHRSTHPPRRHAAPRQRPIDAPRLPPRDRATIAGGLAVATLARRCRLRFRLWLIFLFLGGNGRVLRLAVDQREAGKDLDYLVVQGRVHGLEAEESQAEIVADVRVGEQDAVDRPTVDRASSVRAQITSSTRGRYTGSKLPSRIGFEATILWPTSRSTTCA